MFTTTGTCPCTCAHTYSDRDLKMKKQHFCTTSSWMHRYLIRLKIVRTNVLVCVVCVIYTCCMCQLACMILRANLSLVCFCISYSCGPILHISYQPWCNRLITETVLWLLRCMLYWPAACQPWCNCLAS